jgi:hypothetical protein
MLLHSLFRTGESDYLYDNLSAVAILRKRKINIFYSFGANSLRLACASEIQFLLRLFDEILIPTRMQSLAMIFSSIKNSLYAFAFCMHADLSDSRRWGWRQRRENICGMWIEFLMPSFSDDMVRKKGLKTRRREHP